MATTQVQRFRYPEPTAGPNVPLYLQQLAEDAEIRAVMTFATAAQRTSRLDGRTVHEGAVSYLENDNTHYRWTGTAWEPLVYVGDRFRAYPRTSGNASDDFGAAAYGQLISGTWASAPAGHFELDVGLVMESLGGSTNATIRASANGVDLAAAHLLRLNQGPAHFRPGPYPFVHGGGNIAVLVEVRPETLNGRIYTNGSKAMLRYLGPITRP